MTTPVPALTGRTPEDLRAAIESFSALDWHRLRCAGAYWARHHGLEADDLLQECLERVLDGSRNCPAHLPILTSLAGVLRSIGSDWRKARTRRREVHLVANDGQLVVDPPDDRLNAEEEAGTLQEEQLIKQAILALFEDDLDAQLIVEGDMDGIEGEELRDLTGMDHKAFASKRRLIRRRIDKKFPQGWVL
jgi:RNA polymerase sigma-70 factor (ECF subfamily)